MSINRGWGAPYGSRTIGIGSGRTFWSLKSKALINRNFVQSPLYPLQFDGTSYSYVSSSIVLNLTSSAAGTITFTATGNTFFHRISASAVGTESFLASGSSYLRLLSGSGSGVETLPSSGNISLNNRLVLTSSGISAETFTLTGTGRLQLPSGSAAGTETFVTTGSSVFASYISNTTGTETFTASSNAPLPRISATGSVSFPVIGSGSTSIPSFSGNSTATINYNVSGSTILPQIRMQFGLGWTQTVTTGSTVIISGSGGGEIVRIVRGGSSARPPRQDEYNLRAKMIEHKVSELTSPFIVTAEYLGNEPSKRLVESISSGAVDIKFELSHRTFIFNKK